MSQYHFCELAHSMSPMSFNIKTLYFVNWSVREDMFKFSNGIDLWHYRCGSYPYNILYLRLLAVCLDHIFFIQR